MTFTYDGYNYTLRFERGEKLVEGLTGFIADQGIKGGWVIGLGGLAWAELGFYNLDTKTYEWTRIEELLELSNLTGNIASSEEGLPALHLHATVSDAGMHARAGHLREAETAGTVEVFIHRWLSDEGLSRAKDESTGLNLLKL